MKKSKHKIVIALALSLSFILIMQTYLVLGYAEDSGDSHGYADSSQPEGQGYGVDTSDDAFALSEEEESEGGSGLNSLDSDTGAPEAGDPDPGNPDSDNGTGSPGDMPCSECGEEPCICDPGDALCDVCGDDPCVCEPAFLPDGAVDDPVDEEDEPGSETDNESDLTRGLAKMTEVSTLQGLTDAISEADPGDIITITSDFALLIDESGTYNFETSFDNGSPIIVRVLNNIRHFNIIANSGESEPTVMNFKNVVLEGNGSNNSGGIITPNTSGIYLTINGVIMRECTSSITDGGGAILFASNGTLTVNDCVIENNAAQGHTTSYGGGISATHASSAVIISGDAIISGNIATSNGGGIRANGTLTIGGNVTINGNKAANGGGIWANGALTIDGNVTIEGNTATASGVANGGGGIFAAGTVSSAKLIIKNGATFRDNLAPNGRGGGIFMTRADYLSIESAVSFSGNSSAGTFTLNEKVSLVPYEDRIKVPHGNWSEGRQYGFNQHDIGFGTVDVTVNYFDGSDATLTPGLSGIPVPIGSRIAPYIPAGREPFFEGWYINDKLTGTVRDPNTQVTATTSIWAKWSDRIMVLYQLNNAIEAANPGDIITVARAIPVAKGVHDFVAPFNQGDPIIVKPGGDFRHLYISDQNNAFTLNFENVVLDGEDIAGGIAIRPGNIEISINGAVIRNCLAAQGGAIGYYDMTSSSLICKISINNCVIENNTSTSSFGGGGILVYVPTNAASSLSIGSGSRITGNTGRSGGGIHSRAGLTIDGADGEVLIDGNTATSSGGGIYAISAVSIQNSVTIEGNISADSGGGVFVNGLLTIGENTMIMNNHATGLRASGGGIYINDTRNLSSIAESAVFSGNTSMQNFTLVEPFTLTFYENRVKVPHGNWSGGMRYGFNQQDIGFDTYNVTFNFNGAPENFSPVTGSVPRGSYVTRPTDPTWGDNRFGGWHRTSGFTDVQWNFETQQITANTTFYARWESDWNKLTVAVASAPAGGTVFVYPRGYDIQENVAGGIVVLEQNDDFLLMSDRDNTIPITRSITFKAGDPETPITLFVRSGKRHLKVTSNSAFVSFENIVLDGRIGSDTVSKVGGGIEFGTASSSDAGIILSGAVIRNCDTNVSASTCNGGAIYFSGNINYVFTLTLNNCLIENNSAQNGGGVYINNSGTGTNSKSTLNLGEGTKIVGNKSRADGGGVWAGYELFIDDGVEISGNTATVGGGGGVYMSNTYGLYQIPESTLFSGNISGAAAFDLNEAFSLDFYRCIIPGRDYTWSNPAHQYGFNQNDIGFPVRSVTFDYDDGGMAGTIGPIRVPNGSTISKPPAPVGNVQNVFEGWFRNTTTDANVYDFGLDTVTANTTFRARYGTGLVTNRSQLIVAIANAPLDSSPHTIRIANDFSYGTTAEVLIQRDVDLKLVPRDGLNSVTITSPTTANVRHFVIKAKPNIRNDITPYPRDSALTFDSVILDGGKVSGGIETKLEGVNLRLNGAIIQNCVSSGRGVDVGGGVFFASLGGNLNLVNCRINNNEATVTVAKPTALACSGGGVMFASNGTMTMTGGMVSNNTANQSGTGLCGGAGGGVGMAGGTFHLYDSTIIGNSGTGYSGISGGGVGGYNTIASIEFIMHSGVINSNTANGAGGVRTNSFTMNGGIISGNVGSGSSTNSGGGGVHTTSLSMTGGTISGNVSNPYASHYQPFFTLC